ncbi:TerD family protein [Pseudomonas sp. dw_358]|uniref:TerD family protein n=1 Tax=Pseudomonas sp. dw_358 TaxID=2720083 RepID=UPI001BD4FA43|nr:TerD family protein [Pseudomonas sp. dw_358]
MALSLSKNQTISLDKTAAARLHKITLGVGWDPLQSGFFGKLMGQGGAIDLDASCILFDQQFKPFDLVWFRQLTSRDGAVQHSGDNRTGDGEGDDESIVVELDRLPANIQYLAFTVNSFTGQSFEKVGNAYCRVIDTARHQELARFNLSEQGAHTGIVMACLTRSASGWDFRAIGQTTHGRTADDLVNLAAEALSPASAH